MREREKEKEKERERVCVCACVCVKERERESGNSVLPDDVDDHDNEVHDEDNIILEGICLKTMNAT